MERLKRRTEFRTAAAGSRAAGKTFVLQARGRADQGPARIGFTVSRQVGNAVERNRVRRRLREMVRLSGDAEPGKLQAGHDYVLIGRRAALEVPFGEMMQELDAALRRIHGRDREGTGGARNRPLHDARPASPSGPKPRRNQPSHER